MAAPLETYKRLLSSESNVDVSALRKVARYGVPEEVRGEVWKFLLGLASADKSTEMKAAKSLAKRYGRLNKSIYTEDLRNIGHELKRYKPEKAFFRKSEVCEAFQRVLVAYLNSNYEYEFSPNGSIYLLGPFVWTLREDSEAAVYFCFDSLLKKMEDEDFSPRADAVAARAAHFRALFSATLPNLYEYFEDNLEGHAWVYSWMKFLLAKELRFDATLRLWDCYFSAEEGLDLHYSVCLAVLHLFQEELLEIEDPESLRGFLQHLPAIDIELLIPQAYSYYRESNLVYADDRF